MENKKEPKRNMRLILFPLPLQGHINPMLQLANILHTKGFSITIIHTNFNSPNTKNYPHFTFQPISDSLSEQENATKDAVSLLVSLNKTCIEPFRECLTSLLSRVSRDELISCVITDALWHFSQSVADELRVPRIVLRTSSLSSFIAYGALPLFFEKGYLPKEGK